jgi:hypothetical protein
MHRYSSAQIFQHYNPDLLLLEGFGFSNFNLKLDILTSRSTIRKANVAIIDNDFNRNAI